MSCLYFAFGSNLERRRLEARVGRVEVIDQGTLHGFSLQVNKPGLDGSAKANVVVSSRERVWGVVYRIDAVELEALDRFEGGYRRTGVTIRGRAAAIEAWTYIAEGRTDDLPFDWYKAHMVRGAAEHGLPPSWQQRLRNIPSKPAK